MHRGLMGSFLFLFASLCGRQGMRGQGMLKLSRVTNGLFGKSPITFGVPWMPSWFLKDLSLPGQSHDLLLGTGLMGM